MATLSATPSYAGIDENLAFDLVISNEATACTSFQPPMGKIAFGHATIAAFPPSGPGERPHADVSILPPKDDFVIFIIQVPDKPFGLA
ncbi:MAG: hypothetical protein ACREC4_06490 [Methylocella sp.]